MRRRTFLKLAGGASAGFAAFPTILRAQAPWPDKPVKIVVPFAAGGGTDQLARLWAERLGQSFNQQFVVENRGGASGIIGTEAVAKSAPDGYTFLLSSNSSTVNLHLLRKLPYDAQSLVPVVRVGDAVTGFVVHPSTGLKSLKELIDYARANPGKLSGATPGAGTNGHLRNEMLRFRTGIDFLNVPYRGGADALTDLLAGTVQFMNDPTCNAAAKAGKLTMLCTNHSTRHPDFPDAPTLTEAGYPDSDVPLWFCIWAPAGVPLPIIDAIHAKVTEHSKAPDLPARMLGSGMLPVISTRPELLAFREAESKSMAELIRVANIRLE